jgi:hypothetical protein
MLSTWPCRAASCNGIRCLRPCICAPALSNNSMIVVWPRSAASTKAVLSLLSVASTLAPSCSKFCTAFASPCTTAWCKQEFCAGTDVASDSFGIHIAITNRQRAERIDVIRLDVFHVRYFCSFEHMLKIYNKVFTDQVLTTG